MSEKREQLSLRALELMKNKKMSYRELENMTGISRSTLQRYFAINTSKIPTENISTIAEALGTNPLYLMGLSDNMERKKVISVDTPFGTENEIKDYLKEEPELWETYKKVYSSDTLRILLDGAKDLTPEDLKPILMLIRGIRKDKGLD